MLNNVIVCAIVVLLGAIVTLYCTTKHFYTKCKTTHTELERLRNKCSALEEDNKALTFANQQKQELYNETVQKLNAISNGTANDAIAKLQNRNNRKGSKSSS